MSKAFTSEETDITEVVPPRPELPEGTPNYVTPRGLALLQEERTALASHRARAEAEGDVAKNATLGTRLAELDERLASARVVDSSAQLPDVVRFGATVTVRGERGEERTVRIVGVDEADPAKGDVAFTSPIARALLGKELSDEVTLRTPRGNDALEIIAIRYAP